MVLTTSGSSKLGADTVRRVRIVRLRDHQVQVVQVRSGSYRSMLSVCMCVSQYVHLFCQVTLNLMLLYQKFLLVDMPAADPVKVVAVLTAFV